MTPTPPSAVCNGKVAVTVCVVNADPNTVTISSCAKSITYDAEFTTAIAETLVVPLVVKLPSPEYTAMIGSVVTGMVMVAMPPARVAVPTTWPVTVSMNLTVPVGVPLPGAITATVAVSVSRPLFVLALSVANICAILTVTEPPLPENEP